MIKYNITLEFNNEIQIIEFDKFLNEHCNVIDTMILKDTKELYKNDSHFKELTKEYNRVKRLRNEYINEKC